MYYSLLTFFFILIKDLAAPNTAGGGGASHVAYDLADSSPMGSHQSTEFSALMTAFSDEADDWNLEVDTDFSIDTDFSSSTSRSGAGQEFQKTKITDLFDFASDVWTKTYELQGEFNLDQEREMYGLVDLDADGDLDPDYDLDNGTVAALFDVQ